MLTQFSEQEWTDQTAKHLLLRAGFGPRPGEAARAAELGLSETVRRLLDGEPILAPAPARHREPPPGLAAPAQLPDELQIGSAETQAIRSAEQWWLRQMIETDAPLAEKLVLFWHDHFATNFTGVGSSAFMLQQHATLRLWGTTGQESMDTIGSFAELLKAIVHDPAMLTFLDGFANDQIHPNENLARELMELFSLGPGNYTERDVKEGARALTGFILDSNGQPQIDSNRHDDGLKFILGCRGQHGAIEFVNAILEQDACSRLLAHRFYCYFVENPPFVDEKRAEAVITALSQSIERNAYAIRPVLRELFESSDFYVPHLRGRRVKTPTESLVGTIRMLGAPARDLAVLTRSLAGAGQTLFQPPSVEGWCQGLEWISTSTITARHNAAVYSITGKVPFDASRMPSLEQNGFEPPDHWLDPTISPVVMAERLERELLALPLPTASRECLTMAATRGTGSDLRRSLIPVLLLITASPEFQLA